MTKTFKLFFLPLLCLSVLAYWVQTHFYTCEDVAFLFYSSRIFLQGGHYGVDLLETNPPLIFYLYSPAWFLVKLPFLNWVTGLRAYLFLVAEFSILLSYWMLKKCVSHPRSLFIYTLFLIFAVLFIPTNEFGQRENFYFMFSLPYFLVVVTRLAGSCQISRSALILIGLLAGMVTSLKPFFLLPLLSVEAYYLLKKKSPLQIFRSESLSLAIFILGYVIWVAFFQPEYFKTILPLVSDFYFIGAQTSWPVIFTTPWVVFPISMIVLYGFSKKTDLGNILCLALVGSLMAALITKTDWSYHYMGALAYALLVMAEMLTQEWKLLGQGLKNSLSIAAFISLFTCFCQGYYSLVKLPLIYKKADSPLSQIIQLIKQNPDPRTHSMVCYATSSAICFRIALTSGFQFEGRYPSFWWYKGLSRRLEATSSLPKEMSLHENYIRSAVGEDLKNWHPHWLIWDRKTGLPKTEKALDLHAFLMGDKTFSEAWKQYHYVKSIYWYDIYEYKES